MELVIEMTSKFSSALALSAFVIMHPVYASPQCPVQGLDATICPRVVSLFDQIAALNPEFASHWVNHQWVGQNFDPSSISGMELSVTETINRSLTAPWVKHSSLKDYIDSTLGSAIGSNPDFQKVLDSHNFFLMTVEALTYEMYQLGDRYARNYSQLVDSQVDISLKQAYQQPTSDPFLNKYGIYSTQGYHYAHLDATYGHEFPAGQVVNPVVLAPVQPVTLQPKQPKVTLTGSQKTVGGAVAQVANTANQAKSPVTTISKSTGDGRQRQGPSTVVAGDKLTKLSVSGQNKQVVRVAIASSSKNINVADAKTVGGTPQPLKSQSSNGRLRPPVTTAILKTASSDRGRPAASATKGAGSKLDKTNSAAQLKQGPAVSAVAIPTNSATQSAGSKLDKTNSAAQQKQGPAVSAVVTPTNSATQSAGSKLDKTNSAAQQKQGPVVSAVAIPTNSATQSAGSKLDKTNSAAQQQVLKVGKQVLVNNNATRPTKVTVHQAPIGTDKRNINARFVTSYAGDHTETNQRSYMVTDEGEVWSCVISGLGYRITSDGSITATTHGHVETTHFRSAQIAHIPGNHAQGPGCLVSVSK